VDIADVIQNDTLSSNTKSTVSVASVKVFPSNLDVFWLIRSTVSVASVKVFPSNLDVFRLIRCVLI
jgi:hypothetical protein